MKRKTILTAAAMLALCLSLVLPRGARAMQVELAEYGPPSQVIKDSEVIVQEEEEKSSFPWMWVGIGVGVATGFILAMKKKKK